MTTLYCKQCGTPIEGLRFEKMRCTRCGSRSFSSAPQQDVAPEPTDPIVPWELTERDRDMLEGGGIRPE